jgi:putative transposase
MRVIEFKVKGNKTQYLAIESAIRTAQFIQNKCLRYWMDGENVSRAELYRYNTELRATFPFVKDLNSHATQASVERCWSAIARFYDNCKRKVQGKKGYPGFKKNCRSVEYKTSGWKLLSPKRIQFTDKKGIGILKLIGTWDLAFYSEDQIKRVRVVRRADGYYCQFIISVDVKVETEPTNKTIGLDVGLESFYTDDQGNKVENPRFLRKGEKKLKRLQRRLSKKQKDSKNRAKARQRLSKTHLRISRQRKEYAKRVAYCVIHSNDVVVYEDLKVRNLVKNHCLAKSINDVAWYQFREWLEYFGRKYGKITIPVAPHYTSQNCSSCGKTVKKSLSTRTHVCSCGCLLDRDHNAAKNILRIGLSTVGQTGIYAYGDTASTLLGVILSEQGSSVK